MSHRSSILIPVFLEMSKLLRLSAIILTTLARKLQMRTLELAASGRGVLAL